MVQHIDSLHLAANSVSLYFTVRGTDVWKSGPACLSSYVPDEILGPESGHKCLNSNFLLLLTFYLVGFGFYKMSSV